MDNSLKRPYIAMWMDTYYKAGIPHHNLIVWEGCTPQDNIHSGWEKNRKTP